MRPNNTFWCQKETENGKSKRQDSTSADGYLVCAVKSTLTFLVIFLLLFSLCTHSPILDISTRLTHLATKRSEANYRALCQQHALLLQTADNGTDKIDTFLVVSQVFGKLCFNPAFKFAFNYSNLLLINNRHYFIGYPVSQFVFIHNIRYFINVGANVLISCQTSKPHNLKCWWYDCG